MFSLFFEQEVAEGAEFVSVVVYVANTSPSIYAEGVSSFSPGLVVLATYPGLPVN